MSISIAFYGFVISIAFLMCVISFTVEPTTLWIQIKLQYLVYLTTFVTEILLSEVNHCTIWLEEEILYTLTLGWQYRNNKSCQNSIKPNINLYQFGITCLPWNWQTWSNMDWGGWNELLKKWWIFLAWQEDESNWESNIHSGIVRIRHNRNHVRASVIP